MIDRKPHEDHATLTFTTSEGLTAPGATASFRLYVILTTGNVASSNTVTLVRPAGPNP